MRPKVCDQGYLIQTSLPTSLWKKLIERFCNNYLRGLLGSFSATGQDFSNSYEEKVELEQETGKPDNHVITSSISLTV